MACSFLFRRQRQRVHHATRPTSPGHHDTTSTSHDNQQGLHPVIHEHINTPVSHVTVPQVSPGNDRIFALVIGIDRYPYLNSSRQLHGAVADANNISDFLKNDLKVPPHHIKCLSNSFATRQAILRELKALAEDPRILQGDAILIYFAGHGGEANSPPYWEAGGGTKPQIQMLLPYNYSLNNTKDEDNEGIPDMVFCCYLTYIAERKGDNIAVILDCCHSASGTRTAAVDADLIVRGVETVSGYTIKSHVHDESIKSIRIPGRGSSADAKGYWGLDSHVLISACKQDQSAYETKLDRGGSLTIALLDTLKRHGIGDMSYEMLVSRLPSLHKGKNGDIKQDPQCEGVHKSRVLFNQKVSYLKTQGYRVEASNPGALKMYAGSIDGVVNEAAFAAFRDKSFESPRLGTLYARDVGRFFTFMRQDPPFHIPTDCTVVFARFEGLPEAAMRSTDFRLKIACNIHDQLPSLLQRGDKASDLQCGHIRVVCDKVGIDADIRVYRGSGDHARLDIVDPKCTALGMKPYPPCHRLDIRDNNVQNAMRSLRAIAQYYWYLRHASQDTVATQLECWQLERNQTDLESRRFTHQTIGDNLVRNGCITILDATESSDRMYGFKITSTCDYPLYVALFHFDNTDFSITSYYSGGSAKTADDVEPPLRPRGSLTIGYGSGGQNAQRFWLRSGQNVDVGFIKLFVSTRYIDFRHVAQGPVLGDNADPEYLAQRGTSPVEEPQQDIWGTQEVSVVLKRKGV